MSLAINTTTPEGIVMAADSRQSFRNRKGMARIGSDNASKLFQINKRVGIAVTGLAFLPENGVLKNISKFIEEFKKEIKDIEKINVKEIAEKLYDFFDKKYNWQKQLDELPNKIRHDLKKQGCEILEIKKEKNHIKFRFKDTNGNLKEGMANVDPINFLVTGYNQDSSHEVYICYIPGKIQKKRNSKEKGKEYGASWIGQTDVVSRIVLGFDPRIGSIKFMGNVIKSFDQKEVNKQLRDLEYVIQWGTMTLQDAIDFCTLMIETTSAIQRFSDGIRVNPGGMPGVGGNVDVAVITPDKGFVWVNKKKLKVGENEINLDDFDDLKLSDKENSNGNSKINS